MTRSDDPREVLALLNSLGFVGITASQLKAFMKDLKIYRKMKERERQQKKEEMKNKIRSKQIQMMREMMDEVIREYSGNSSSSTTVTSTTETSNIYSDSLVNIKISCDPDIETHFDRNVFRKYEDNSNDKFEKPERDTSRPRMKPRKETEVESPWKDATVCRDTDNVDYSGRSGKKVGKEMEKRPFSAPELIDRPCRVKTTVSAPTVNTVPVSRSKSFIRPWRLQPERQTVNKKSDPVALYHKYQQEWKQISFPGEEKHASVRWAVREKMLGTDPNPRPLPVKSSTSTTAKKPWNSDC